MERGRRGGGCREEQGPLEVSVFVLRVGGEFGREERDEELSASVSVSESVIDIVEIDDHWTYRTLLSQVLH